MKTFNRAPANINTSGIKNYSKYFNQMNFKGISEDDNIYAIDQETLRDANNVYVNDDNRLVSRPTLQKDSLPSEINVYNYDLEDVKYIGQNIIYVSKSKNYSSYFILLVDKDGNKHSIKDIDEYTTTIDLDSNSSIKITITPAGGINWEEETNCYVSTSGLGPNSYFITSTVTNEIWTLWYEFKSNGDLTIEIFNGEGYDNLFKTFTINIAMTKYHISSIEQYIICWNNLGAKVFDSNESSKGWQDFNNFIEIPIIKTISGSVEKEFAKNEFTALYKEQYTYDKDTYPLLPITKDTAEVEVFTESSETLKYNIEYAHNLTDYKIFKTSNVPVSYYNSAASYNSITNKYVVAIPLRDKVFISYNGGNTYKSVLYPEYSGTFHGGYLTEDALYYCFISDDGIYFLQLGDLIWSKETLEIKHNQIIYTCFKTRQIYSFLTQLTEKHATGRNRIRLYFKGPSLYSGTDSSKDNTLTYIDQVLTGIFTGNDTFLSNFADLIDLRYNYVKNNRLKMFLTKNNQNKDIVIISLVAPYNKEGDNLITIIGGTNMYKDAFIGMTPADKLSGMFTCAEQFQSYTNFSIEDGEVLIDLKDDDVYKFKYNLIGDVVNNLSDTQGEHNWKSLELILKITVGENQDNQYFPVVSFEATIGSLPKISSDHIYYESYLEYYTTPLKLNQTYIYRTVYNKYYILDNNTNRWLELPKIGDLLGQVQLFTTAGDKYFVIANNIENSDEMLLLTNLFADKDLATITYTLGEESKYTKVPNVSYSDTELYLGFDNMLQITQNVRNNEKISFSLPTTNNQTFIDNITAMINISTTEVALFFLNKVIICSKVQDTNLAQGFRYDYYNTKLSTGVRLGDDIINTLEGQYTVFSTKRGLAIMNYQAFMATSDQVITYITDNIKDIWNAFYNNSNYIKIIQWRNNLVLTNNTKLLLLYDLTKNTWWKWEVPVNIKLPVTDQIDLRVVDTNLNVFKEATQYYDFSEIGDFKTINWFIISQPLHMSAPNYYKNLKQIIFQFSNSNDDEILTKTINVQIKLYRKRISIKEPETIQFQIENLRSFVKRFNYWKINETQWALANDTDTNVPKKLELNSISIKYEIGDEVR